MTRAHMIDRHKIVQYHRKQCALIPSLALDVTHKKTCLRLASNLLICSCLKSTGRKGTTSFFDSDRSHSAEALVGIANTPYWSSGPGNFRVVRHPPTTGNLEPFTTVNGVLAIWESSKTTFCDFGIGANCRCVDVTQTKLSNVRNNLGSSLMMPG
jgi:hypothetical protein